MNSLNLTSMLPICLLCQIPVYKEGIETDDEKPAQCNNQIIEDIAFQSDRCNFHINASDWSRVYKVPIFPAYSDVDYAKITKYRVALTTLENLQHKIWSYYNLPPVEVCISNHCFVIEELSSNVYFI